MTLPSAPLQMSAQIYFSSGAFLASSLENIFDQCEAEGLPGLELSSGLPHLPGMVQALRNARKRPIEFLVHNYFPPPAEPFVLNLAARDPATLSATRDHCRLGVMLSREHGAPFYSVHSGFAMNLSACQLGQPEEQARLPFDRPAAEEAFARNVDDLAAYARAQGVGLLLENNVLTKTQVAAGRAESLLLTTPSEARAFLDAHPGVGLLLDVGHAAVTGRALGFAPEAFFTEVSDRIGALHLSGNDGERDTNSAFDADAWFAPWLKQFAHLPMVIEVYRLDAAARARHLELLRRLTS